jgi:undecaprenyl-diphosphatase
LLGFGLIFAAVRSRRSEAIDLALTIRLQRRRRPWLDRLMTAASWPGFPPQSRLIPPVAIGGLWILRFRTEAAFEAAAWGTGALSTVLKTAMERPRPVAGTDLRVVAAPLGGSSFPSGHVITFVGTYGFLAYLADTLIRDRATRRLATAGLVGLVLLVGPSRIYQGHHWPTDVSASYLLGTSYLLVVIGGYRAVKRHERRDPLLALATAAAAPRRAVGP